MRKRRMKNWVKRIACVITLFLLAGAGSLYVSVEPGQAKTYSSAKQVKTELDRVNKKIAKLKAAYNKAYAEWENISSGKSIGTLDSKYMDRVYVKRGNPLIILSGNTYYYLNNRISTSSYFSGNIRTTGGYTTIDGLTCVNAQVVSGPKSYHAANLAAKKFKKYESQIEELKGDRSYLKSILNFKVKPKTKTIYVGNTIKLKPENTHKNKITWKSSNSAIATVGKNGVVKGKKAGKVTITAKTNLSKKTSKITVKVKGVKPKPPLNLELPSYLAIGETAEIRDTIDDIVLYSSDEDIVSIDHQFGADARYIIKGKSAGKATITAFYNGRKDTMQNIEITVYEPHIIFEQTKYDFDASSLGTDVTIYFKSNIPTKEGSRSLDIFWSDGEYFIDRCEAVIDRDIIYEKKEADGVDVRGALILHLDDVGTAKFQLWGFLDYDYDCKSAFIDVSVTGHCFSYQSGDTTTYLQDGAEISILSRYSDENNVTRINGLSLKFHGNKIHKLVSSDESILSVSYDGVIELVAEGKPGTAKLTVFTEEKGERIELTVHVCSLDIMWDDGSNAYRRTYEWKDEEITSYFSVDFISDAADIEEVKGEVIQSDGHLTFGEYKDGKLFFTIDGMENPWLDEYIVKITVNGISVEREIQVSYEPD